MTTVVEAVAVGMLVMLAAASALGAHLDFTLILWPYYVAVAALYGVITALARSIWPAVVLHTAGNLYSNVDLLLHGRAEWQAPAAEAVV